MSSPPKHDVADMFLLEAERAATQSAAYSLANALSPSARWANGEAAEFAACYIAARSEAEMWRAAYLNRQIERC